MICQVPPLESFIAELLPSLRPRAACSSWDWICRNGRMPDGSPFDGDRIPWCEGVCDAWDDPETRHVSLQWGTRLGKTTIGLQLLAKSAATQPRPGLFATSTQSLAKRTVRNKIYPVLDAIHQTRSQLPDERWWTVEEIRLKDSPWAVAWSGSDTQLADLSAFYGYANEIDKWSLNEKLGGDAGEGDPLDQFEERFKEFPNAKLMFECSPSTKRHSRIEKKLLASNDCRYWVPCPQCGGRQVLKFGADDREGGGIVFDKCADGSLDVALARTTARYICAYCKYEIHDDQRPRMMRSGRWAPAGCEVDKRGRLKGTPQRGNRLWGGQLSSLYSLQMRWGDIAEKFVQSLADARSLRMFINGWLSETWEPYRSKSEPDEIGERLSTEFPKGVIPAWATWLFAAIDCQEDHYVYLVEACGPGEREHLVDYGKAETLDWIEENVIRRAYEHQDGGTALCPAMTGIDSGFRTKEVYTFCQRFRGTPHKVIPVKGANTDCAGEAYEIKVIGVNEGVSARTKKTLMRSGRGLTRLRVNPYYYEPITQEQLENRAPGEPGSLSLCREASRDSEMLRQLCNGAESSEPSKTDPNRSLWVKRWASEPNDFRDAKKYCRCLMDYRFRRNWKAVERRQGAASPVVVAAEPLEASAKFRPARFKPSMRRGGR